MVWPHTLLNLALKRKDLTSYQDYNSGFNECVDGYHPTPTITTQEYFIMNVKNLTENTHGYRHTKTSYTIYTVI
jgi:hypothetical protein